ncbi:MAG TPA: arginine--tRNA ligase [Candidatus Krumholzibacteria bacterium]|nr:arginine--tRNA ligase [Candidatus Krumholzibacteria bacterium]HPD71266.1 arginine--tRNA ligase [Candidatus Krumholzibacteria bacterium]HRY39034.1 arginine--tRNA ligase [Candidatus Krumholzibacteria bacterium]
MIEAIIREAFKTPLEKLGLYEDDVVIDLEKPRDRSHGDLSTNLALSLAKPLGRRPRELAGELAAGLEFDKDLVESVEIAGPGFINFRLGRPYHIGRLLALWSGAALAEIRSGGGKRINVEFISANPTGPLNVVSARAGAFGMTLCRLLEAVGYDAHSEYYVNDAGRQVTLLGASLRANYLQLRGRPFLFPEGGYEGRYLEIMASELLDQDSAAIQLAAKAFDNESFQRVTAPEGNAEDWCALPEDESVRCFAKYALMKILGWQRETCQRFGLRFDTWYFESELHETKRIERTLDALRKSDRLFEQEGALWFRSTAFGDEKDRVLVRADGEPTYFLADLAYHHHKHQRGFEYAIDYWGPDHHGYILRMQGGMRALGVEEGWLEVEILQHVTFLEDGRPITMSKRKGQFVTMDALMDEVGADVAKFFFLTRKPNSHLEFDLDLARAESSENPVYYVKYAHARICSVLRNAVAAGVAIGEPTAAGLAGLTHESEWNLVRELIRLPQIVTVAAQAREPHRLTGWVVELAGLFHQFYHQCKIIDPEAPQLTDSRLMLCQLTRLVIAKVLELIGVDAPEHMGEKD